MNHLWVPKSVCLLLSHPIKEAYSSLSLFPFSSHSRRNQSVVSVSAIRKQNLRCSLKHWVQCWRWWTLSTVPLTANCSILLTPQTFKQHKSAHFLPRESFVSTEHKQPAAQAPVDAEGRKHCKAPSLLNSSELHQLMLCSVTSHRSMNRVRSSCVKDLTCKYHNTNESCLTKQK